MEWVHPDTVENHYGDAVNPRKETSRGLEVHEFVELAKEHGGELKVGWYPSKPEMLDSGRDESLEVDPEEAVNMRLNAIRVTATSLDDVHEFLQSIPPGVITNQTDDGLELILRVD